MDVSQFLREVKSEVLVPNPRDPRLLGRFDSLDAEMGTYYRKLIDDQKKAIESEREDHQIEIVD